MSQNLAAIAAAAANPKYGDEYTIALMLADMGFYMDDHLISCVPKFGWDDHDQYFMSRLNACGLEIDKHPGHADQVIYINNASPRLISAFSGIMERFYEAPPVYPDFNQRAREIGLYPPREEKRSRKVFLWACFLVVGIPVLMWSFIYF